MANERNMDVGDPSTADGDDEKLAAALASVAAMERADDGASADAAWQKFQARLVESDPEATDLSDVRLRPSNESQVRTSAWRRVRAPRTGLGWFATAQTAALAAIAFLLIPQGTPEQSDEFRTLNANDPAFVPRPAGNAVLVFDPAVTSANINETLTSAGAQIVDGPMANGGYVVRIEEGRLNGVIEELRSSESVLLVETLAAEEQP